MSESPLSIGKRPVQNKERTYLDCRSGLVRSSERNQSVTSWRRHGLPKADSRDEAV